MKGIKKFIGIALAVAIGTSGVLAQSVPVRAKTQAISISNVKNGKATLYTGQSLSLKTNYKENQLTVSTSDNSVVSVKGIKITGVNKGTAKVTVAVKSNTKVKKTITVKVVDRYITRKSDEGGNAVTEKYDRKTKKSTYTVAMTGTDNHSGLDINLKLSFVSKATNLMGTGCAGELSNGAGCVLRLYNITKSESYKPLIDFDKMSDNDLYKYYELTKEEIKQTKFTHNNTEAGYVLALSMPDEEDTYVDCLIKDDKETGTLYELVYKGSEDPYTVYKSVKVLK